MVRTQGVLLAAINLANMYAKVVQSNAYPVQVLLIVFNVTQNLQHLILKVVSAFLSASKVQLRSLLMDIKLVNNAKIYVKSVRQVSQHIVLNVGRTKLCSRSVVNVLRRAQKRRFKTWALWHVYNAQITAVIVMLIIRKNVLFVKKGSSISKTNANHNAPISIQNQEMEQVVN